MCYCSYIFNIAKFTYVTNYKLFVIGRSRITWFLLGAILLAVPLSAACQWKVVHYEARTENAMDLLPSGKRLSTGYTFFGVSDDFSENVITTAFQPFVQDTLWKVVLNAPHSAFLRHLYFNLYTINVAALKIHICENNGKCYEQSFKILKNGYQVPLEWALDDRTKLAASYPQHRSGTKPMLFATLQLKDKSKPFQLAVGEAKTYQKSFIEQNSQGFFFYELTGKEENRVKNSSRTRFGDGYPLLQMSEFNTPTGSAFNFKYQNSDSLATQKATLRLIRYFFQKYGFYQEHALEQHKVIDSVEQIIAGHFSFNTQLQLLKEVATGLHDGHFYFRESVASQFKISSPLILKRINNQVQVVGIRDARLVNQIGLGDQVYRIDGQLCEKFVDSLSVQYFGKIIERQELAISHLLERKIDSTTHTITLAKPDGAQYEVAVAYDSSFPIPKQFVPEHFGYRQIEPGWSYLKINKWDKGDWIKFYNLKDSIKNSKGIIFDLRGNPGGYEIEVLKIASCFLQQPFDYATETYTRASQTYSAKTIVKPNPFLTLSKLKVILLVDNKTACGSESFALIFKRILGATIIGTSTTGSSFSTVHAFQFPGGISLNANVLSKKYLLSDQSTLEYRGIAPDITVKIDNYSELYGYEDKVLQTARKLIRQPISK